MVRRVSNRMARFGRGNPGRAHLVGADITARMQRQYEHILESLRDYHRFSTDQDRKAVAAATVHKLANPSGEERQARLLAEEFHGRPAREVIEVIEREEYREWGSILGYLEELGILTEDAEAVIPIRFRYGDKDPASVLLMSDPKGNNLMFAGGDQDIDWQNVEGASAESKDLVYVGPVLLIAYFTDKHHLSGPKSQADGTVYEHEFGEDGGDIPHLVFDRLNTRMLLVGGSYTVKPEGIAG